MIRLGYLITTTNLLDLLLCLLNDQESFGLVFSALDMRPTVVHGHTVIRMHVVDTYVHYIVHV